jgi:predicted aspartyl protease
MDEFTGAAQIRRDPYVDALNLCDGSCVEGGVTIRRVMAQLYSVMALATLAFAPVHAGELTAYAPAALESTEEDEHLYAAPTRWDRIGRIAAPVMINGQGPFRMILDTGANQSVITQRVANALGLPMLPDAQVLLHGVTGSAPVPFVELQTLTTGDLVQENIKVAVLGSVMGGADGILGTQGFEGLRVTVEFTRDRITIARSRGQRARRSEGTIPATLRFGRLLVVDGHVGRIRVKAVIDTGAEMTLGNLALRDALLRRRGSKHAPDDALVIGLDYTSQSGRYLRTPLIQLGDAEIDRVPVIYGDIHVFKLWDLEEEPALLVGMDILGSLERLVIDYRREEIQFRNRYRMP